MSTIAVDTSVKGGVGESIDGVVVAVDEVWVDGVGVGVVAGGVEAVVANSGVHRTQKLCS